LARLTGDGLGNFGVSLGTIATARVDAGGQPILFRGTSTGNEADDTPIGSTEALVSFPGSPTLFDVPGLGTSPLLFDPVGSGQAVKVLATTADTAFDVTQTTTDTLVAVTDQSTGLALLGASTVSADTARLLIQGGAGNDALTVDSTSAPIAIP